MCRIFILLSFIMDLYTIRELFNEKIFANYEMVLYYH